jgi:hypothetical protein
MFLRLRYRFCALVVAFALILGAPSLAQAAWVTIKNDSGKTIVVQDIVVVNGQVKRGKPTNLLPGETIREFLPGPTLKKIEVLDAQNQLLWSGNLNCKDENQTFCVTAASGKVTVGPVATPPKK